MSTCVYFGCRLESFVACPVASPVPARTLEKQVFAWRVCRFSHFGPLRARPKIKENEPKTHDRKQPKCSATRARGRKQKTPSKIVDLGALSSPKSTPGLPKAAQEASRSGWATTEAESRGQERPRHASKGFRVPLAGKCDFRRGLREGSE